MLKYYKYAGEQVAVWGLAEHSFEFAAVVDPLPVITPNPTQPSRQPTLLNSTASPGRCNIGRPQLFQKRGCRKMRGEV